MGTGCVEACQRLCEWGMGVEGWLVGGGGGVRKREEGGLKGGGGWLGPPSS